MTDAITKILGERRGTHGDFTVNARLAQHMLRVMTAEREGWERLTDVQREALWMFCHKMARIVGGDPNHRDHWDDIAGYARLASERIITAEEMGLSPDWSPRPEAVTIVGRERVVLKNDGSGSVLLRRPSVADGSRHAAARPMDGMPRSYYDELEIDSIGGFCANETALADEPRWLVDRRVAPREFWDHLPRLAVEQNHKEWSELPREYAALFEWDVGAGKYVMRAEFREWWGRE